MGRTKAAGGGEGITRLYSIFQAGAPAYTSNYEQNVCVYKLVLGIALAWLHRGGETTASCAEVSAPTLHLLPPSTKIFKLQHFSFHLKNTNIPP